MRWKAGSLLIGIALLFNGFAGMISRRAEIADEHRRSLELTASLTAARLDASIAKAATTLSVAAPRADLDRLARALGVSVCAVGDRTECFQPQTGLALIGGEGDFVDPLVADAIRKSGRRAETAALSAAAVASAGSDAPARAIVVVVDQGDRLLVAVVLLPDVMVVPASLVSAAGDDSYAAPLESDLGGEQWWALVTGDSPTGLRTRERLTMAIQLALGALLVAGSAVAVARDHRGLRRRATTDSLTGLPNRAEFERLATRALTQFERDGRGGCLIVIDLDRFKSINDTVGHAAGDRVLREAGTRLASAVRPSDLVGRWGGDEFVLLLVGINDLLAVPERTAAIAACLSDVPGAAGAGLTASFGAAVFPLQGHDLATLLDVADRAMYEAKSGTDRSLAPDRAAGDAVPWRA